MEETPVEGPSLEEGGRLDLMCIGGGSANKMDATTAFGSSSYSGNVYGSYGGSSYYNESGSGSATVVTPRAQGFQDQVSLFVEGNEGRVRMPRTMLPTIRGGENGWFKLKDIKISANEITASVSVNPLNNPKLRLDRYAGSVSISGKAGDFTGQCRRFNPAAMQRQF